MITKTNNSLPRSPDGMNSDQELKKAQVESENAMITEIGLPSCDAHNSHQQDLYKDQWAPENTSKGISSLSDVLVSQAKADKSTTNIKEPTSLEYPNVPFKKP